MGVLIRLSVTIPWRERVVGIGTGAPRLAIFTTQIGFASYISKIGFLTKYLLSDWCNHRSYGPEYKGCLHVIKCDYAIDGAYVRNCPLIYLLTPLSTCCKELDTYLFI